MNPALIDTDILSAILGRNPLAVARADEYVAQHRRLAFSEMTRFEVLRGFEAKQARRRIEVFQAACTGADVLPITIEILDRAAVVYGELHRAGHLIPDADLIIGVTALVHGLEMVTNNVRHFSRIPGLRVVNWLDERAR
jgi:tRNA(fMet)-specific endonuclease VapC